MIGRTQKLPIVMETLKQLVSGTQDRACHFIYPKWNNIAIK